MEKAYLCVDIGGTKTAVAIFGENREERFYGAFPTRPAEGAAALTERVYEFVADKLRGYDVSEGVIAAPGPLDCEEGILINLVTLGWKNIPIIKLFVEKFHIAFTLINDCDAGVLGVAEEFGFTERGTVCYISISTGIGGGTVVHGKVLNGAGNASDFGHIPVAGEGLVCGCGQIDCLELYSSGSGIENRYKMKSGRAYPCADIARMAREGDVWAKQIFSDAAEYIAYAVRVISAMIDPDLIVFGGSVCQSGDLLFTKINNNGIKTVCTSAEGKQVLYGAFVLLKINCA